ncbi:hypothetical protein METBISCDRAFT_27617 [Metschnikowia bicuspidata]|uniref:Uncharacterized protein n=1 Tax=Metschnikowia bicuspidata TaxID=27322 RepID=A0A4P9ZBG7_9ASCO|nr:hypothetical protein METBISCDRAFT_27617 [Metschnikowia bicuspidata]
MFSPPINPKRIRLVLLERASSLEPLEIFRGTPSLPTFDDFVSPNSGALDRRQFRKLALSPLSKKIHILHGPLSNLIPFQLRLPPRLSQSLEQKKDRFPTRMIFNGETYEPYFSDTAPLDEEAASDNDDTALSAGTLLLPETLLLLLGAGSDAPRGALWSSGTWGRRGIERKNLNLLKQLSIIREKSVREFSPAQNSAPPTPPTSAPKIPLPSQRLFLGNLGKPVVVLDDDFQRGASTETSHDASPDFAPKTLLSRSAPERSKPASIPTTATFRYSMFLGGTSPLKVTKRIFSDESTDLSVNSFSTVGDAFLKSCASMAAAPSAVEGCLLAMRGPVCRTPLSSAENAVSAVEAPRTSGEPLRSSGSLDDDSDDFSDESVPITPGNTDSASVSASLLTLHLSEPLSASSTELCSFPAETATSGELECKKRVNVPDSDGVIKPLEIAPAVSSDSSFDDTCGAGMKYNFPNNALNTTNGDRAKKKTPHRRAPGSLFGGHMTPNGQIEIPELGEESPLKTKSVALPASHPSADDGDSTTDSEASFNSQFSSLHAKWSRYKHIRGSKSMDANQSPKLCGPSSVRHTHHRSVFTIDTAGLDIGLDDTLSRKEEPTIPTKTTATPLPAAQSKLNAFARWSSTAAAETPAETRCQTPPEPRRSQKVPDIPAADTESIPVTEPPPKVTYPIDFRAPASKPQRSLNYKYFYSNGHTRSLLSLPSYQRTDSEPSSYFFSRKDHEIASTAATETESVTIDLTKEKYDMCLVKRQDLALLYRSVIENTRDGRKIEVVLVDDHEEEEGPLETDELLKIYAQYMGDWNKHVQRQYARGSLRKTALNCSALDANASDSNCSQNSWDSDSAADFTVKSVKKILTPHAILRPQKLPRSLLVKGTVDRHHVAKVRGIPPRRNSPLSPEWQDAEIHALVLKLSLRHDYLDYSQGSYDFNS